MQALKSNQGRVARFIGYLGLLVVLAGVLLAPLTAGASPLGGGTLGVHAVATGTDKSIAGAVVYVQSTNSNAVIKGVTNADGDYAVTLPVGSYIVKILATNYQEYKTTAQVNLGQPTKLVPRLQPTAASDIGSVVAQIRASAPTTQPTLAQITVFRADGTKVAFGSTPVGSDWGVKLPVGDYTLLAEAQNYNGMKATVHVAADTTAQVTLTLEPQR